MKRTIAVLFATALTTGSLAACQVETQKCSNGTCTLSLKGAQATTKLGGEGGSDITLISASGKTAKVKIATSTGVLTVGEPVKLDNGTLTLTKVKGTDSVEIKVVGEKAGAGTSPDSTTTTN